MYSVLLDRTLELMRSLFVCLNFEWEYFQSIMGYFNTCIFFQCPCHVKHIKLHKQASTLTADSSVYFGDLNKVFLFAVLTD